MKFVIHVLMKIFNGKFSYKSEFASKFKQIYDFTSIILKTFKIIDIYFQNF